MRIKNGLDKRNDRSENSSLLSEDSSLYNNPYINFYKSKEDKINEYDQKNKEFEQKPTIYDNSKENDKQNDLYQMNKNNDISNTYKNININKNNNNINNFSEDNENINSLFPNDNTVKNSIFSNFIDKQKKNKKKCKSRTI